MVFDFFFFFVLIAVMELLCFMIFSTYSRIHLLNSVALGKCSNVLFFVVVTAVVVTVSSFVVSASVVVSDVMVDDPILVA